MALPEAAANVVVRVRCNICISALANRRQAAHGAYLRSKQPKAIHMYYGGGLLGTLLIVALIVFLVRRSRI
jgi:hypothetical protein